MINEFFIKFFYGMGPYLNIMTQHNTKIGISKFNQNLQGR